jgi:hypothetical protein
MKRALFSLLLVVTLLAGAAVAREIAGLEMPDSIKAGDSDLLLNGGGRRTKFGMTVYVGALYLPSPSSDPRAILAADEPMAIELHITSGMVTSEKMESATREGFENSLNGETAPLKQSIDDFIAVFREKIEKGDRYSFVYRPEKGTEVFKNGKLSRTIGKLDFKKALFGIWLCDRPAQESLKREMLGL